MAELLIFWSAEFRLIDFLASRVDQQAAIFASNSKLTLKIETLTDWLEVSDTYNSLQSYLFYINYRNLYKTINFYSSGLKFKSRFIV